MNAVTPSIKRSLKAGKAAKRKTSLKTANKPALPEMAIQGKRTIEQLKTEIQFADALAGGQYDALAKQVRQMKKEGKLVDCSV